MTDAGRTEKEQTDKRICRELMEKLDKKALKQLRKVCRVTGNFMWRLQTAGTFCCGYRMDRRMNGRKRRLI